MPSTDTRRVQAGASGEPFGEWEGRSPTAMGYSEYPLGGSMDARLNPTGSSLGPGGARPAEPRCLNEEADRAQQAPFCLRPSAHPFTPRGAAVPLPAGAACSDGRLPGQVRPTVLFTPGPPALQSGGPAEGTRGQSARPETAPPVPGGARFGQIPQLEEMGRLASDGTRPQPPSVPISPEPRFSREQVKEFSAPFQGPTPRSAGEASASSPAAPGPGPPMQAEQRYLPVPTWTPAAPPLLPAAVRPDAGPATCMRGSDFRAGAADVGRAATATGLALPSQAEQAEQRYLPVPTWTPAAPPLLPAAVRPDAGPLTCMRGPDFRAGTADVGRAATEPGLALPSQAEQAEQRYLPVPAWTPAASPPLPAAAPQSRGRDPRTTATDQYLFVKQAIEDSGLDRAALERLVHFTSESDGDVPLVVRMFMTTRQDGPYTDYTRVVAGHIRALIDLQRQYALHDIRSPCTSEDITAAWANALQVEANFLRSGRGNFLPVSLKEREEVLAAANQGPAAHLQVWQQPSRSSPLYPPAGSRVVQPEPHLSGQYSSFHPSPPSVGGVDHSPPVYEQDAAGDLQLRGAGSGSGPSSQRGQSPPFRHVQFGDSSPVQGTHPQPDFGAPPLPGPYQGGGPPPAPPPPPPPPQLPSCPSSPGHVGGLAEEEVVRQLVQQHGVPEEGLGKISWFDYQPTADRRSTSLQRAPYTLAVLRAQLLHRELRRARRVLAPAQVPVLDLRKVVQYFTQSGAGGREYAAQRGNFHVALVESRYEIMAVRGSVSQACSDLVELLVQAAKSVLILRDVIETVLAIACASATPSDELVHSLLVIIERELLPSSDLDAHMLMAVKWHPEEQGEHVVRTAHALLSKLNRLVAFTQGVAATGSVALEHFRYHVQLAQGLSMLSRDEMGRSLPDLIWAGYCSTETRLTYSTVSRLLAVLKEPSSLGQAVIAFVSDQRSGGERRRHRGPPAERVVGLNHGPSALERYPDAFVVDEWADAEFTGDAALGDMMEGLSVAEVDAAVAGGYPRRNVVDVPPRPRGLNYADLELVARYANVISVRKARPDVPAEFIPLAQIEAQELWNARRPDGMYGAADIGACAICAVVFGNARRSQHMFDFKRANGGLAPCKEAPVPEDIILIHPSDACPRRWTAIDIACKRGEIPLEVAVGLSAEKRAIAVAASKARQGL